MALAPKTAVWSICATAAYLIRTGALQNKLADFASIYRKSITPKLLEKA